MELMELPNHYLNALAQQLIFIAAFLGGFSATILGTLIVSDIRTKYSKRMVVSAALSSMCFIVTVFGMTGVLVQTTEGYPLTIDTQELVALRSVAMLTLMIGLLSFLVCLSNSGWLISKRIGWFTTILGVIAFLVIIIMMS